MSELLERTVMASGRPVAQRAPDHIVTLLRNLFDVNGLMDIHEALTGADPGRRRGVEILNKSALVLLVACWEAYIEDLAAAGSKQLIRHAKAASDVPSR